MPRTTFRTLGFPLFALALASAPLAGCSSASFGGASAFGGKHQQVAEVSNISGYDAGNALGEARKHFKNNNFGYSAAFYKRVVELSPNDPEGYVGLGASYDQLRRFDLSDRVYASLYKLSGGTAQYYNNLGYSHMLRGDLNTALKNFREADRLDPGNVVVGNNIQLLSSAVAKTQA